MAEETLIKINIKCSNADKAEVTILPNATVSDLKEKINEVLSVAVAQQRLIFRGRVLKVLDLICSQRFLMDEVLYCYLT